MTVKKENVLKITFAVISVSCLVSGAICLWYNLMIWTIVLLTLGVILLILSLMPYRFKLDNKK